MHKRALGRQLRAIVGVVAIVSVLVAGSLVPASAKKTKVVGSLGVGESIFWNGPWVEGPAGFRPTVHWAEWYLDYAQEVGSGQTYCQRWGCWEYHLEVEEPGQRLRIGLDQPLTKDYDYFWFELYRPDGTYCCYGDGIWAQEATIENAQAGTWKIVVAPYGVTESTFRMRAKLQRSLPPPSGGKELLAPNLRADPPFEMGFGVPQYVHWLIPTWSAGELADCNWDEAAEEGARRCLRLSVGVQNAGDGPLELRYSSPLEAKGEPTMFQRLNYSDGSTSEREAGTYEYHKTHAHYHFLGFSKLDLYRVTDAVNGELEHAGIGHKVGFCLGDTLIAEWRQWYQAPAFTAQSDCDSPTQAWMGLSTGWTDIYTWDTPGNYVEFGDNPDGLYLVRNIVDASRGILETDESDNVGYAYIEVEGDDVRVIERGLGRHPWDPKKVVLADWWRQLAGGDSTG